MKRNRWIMLAFLLISAGTWYYMADAAPTTKKIQTPSFTGNYPGLYLTVESVQTKAYTMAMSVPRTDHDAVNEKLDAFIAEKRALFEAELVEHDKRQGHLNIQTDTVRVSETVYALVVHTYAFTGGANGTATVNVFRFDVATGEWIGWDDVFQTGNESKDWFKKVVSEEAQKNDYVFEELLDEALRTPETTNWLLTSSGLTVWFDEYEVAAGAAGAIEVNIPFEVVKPYVTMDVDEEKNDREDVVTPYPNRKPLDPDGKYVALTFDDGPHPTVTPQVLAALKQYDARATFFMLGSQMAFYPDVAKAVAAAGHELANHTDHHPNLAQLSADAIDVELTAVDTQIEAIIGEPAYLVRPPYGSKNEVVERTIESRGQTLALWTVDSLDWSHRDASQMHELIMGGIHPNAVVLMHDIHESTAEGLPRVLASLQEEGYEFVTMSELLTIK
ncbi:polysaccharide deacetylase family protein [Exiguobacterium alkaliphilum]|uniref:polysaccharide deacetylase family protein n=1 Tax=Exiguobacterium alkaliphilum TaxID=1428684 RepID=UPI003464DF01